MKVREQEIKDRINRTVKYVIERKCKRGGFCFYRLDEPNASDTYYALSILNLTGTDSTDFGNNKTITFLRNMQNADGSYRNILQAYYSISALSLLDEAPKYSPEEYIRKSIKTYNSGDIMGCVSIFRELYYLIKLCHKLGVKIDKNNTKKIIDFVLNFRNTDYGFGNNVSTLIETYHALSVLCFLNYSVNSLKTGRFVQKCESQAYGFLNIPEVNPSFIEYIYAGIAASVLLKRRVEYQDRCIEFIIKCQRINGGFSRTVDGGIATLNNTYYAINALSLLGFI